MNGDKGDKPIRVLIIDDHQMFRDALRVLLEKEDGIELAAATGDELEGIELAVRNRPEVVLLDIAMRGIGGILTAHKLREKVPRSKVLMVSQHDDMEFVLEALGTAQAAGYLNKNDGGTELVNGIRAVAAGKRYISPSVAPVVLENLHQSSNGHDEVLTKREREILSLIAQGVGPKAIAVKLRISPKTVQVHRANLTSKLNLSSTAAIVRYAIKHKFLKLD